MKTWRVSCCFLVGHRLYQPTAGVDASERCGDAREWNQRPWSRLHRPPRGFGSSCSSSGVRPESFFTLAERRQLDRLAEPPTPER
jgi:hypothetical protein